MGAQRQGMATGGSLARYSIGAIILHWLIAILIFLNIYQGLKMGSASGLAKFMTFQNHKSVGITILVLSVLRLVWRLVNPPPPSAPGLAPWEKTLSHVTHWGFYVIMIGMPLTGWLAVSASPINLPTLLYRIWGMPGIPWPHLPVVPHLPLDQKRIVESAAVAVHSKMAWAAYILIALHIAGALKHQFFDPHPVLYRMVPFLKAGGPAEPEFER